MLLLMKRIVIHEGNNITAVVLHLMVLLLVKGRTVWLDIFCGLPDIEA
jgi:hypothetical protein